MTNAKMQQTVFAMASPDMISLYRPLRTRRCLMLIDNAIVALPTCACY